MLYTNALKLVRGICLLISGVTEVFYKINVCSVYHKLVTGKKVNIFVNVPDLRFRNRNEGKTKTSNFQTLGAIAAVRSNCLLGFPFSCLPDKPTQDSSCQLPRTSRNKETRPVPLFVSQ